MELLHSGLLDELHWVLDQPLAENALASLQLFQHKIMSFVRLHVIVF